MVIGNPIILGGSGGGGGLTPSDEGKVVSNGELVTQTSLTVTENDTYDTTLHDEVIVNVASGVMYEIKTKVSGGYNGGAVISIEHGTTTLFTATASDTWNLQYNKVSETLNVEGVGTVEITITPPSSSTEKLGIEIKGPVNTISYTSISPNGANTSYGYNFTELDNLFISSGGGVTEISRNDWNALTTAQKQAYGLVAIVDYQSGFIRGEYVNGAEYIPLNVYIPYSNVSQVLCEAYLDNFNPLDLSWGFGNSPVILTNVVSENNGAVSIPVKTDGVLAYVDLGASNTTFTAYVVMKSVNPSQYSRMISAMDARTTAQGMLLYGSTLYVGSWADDTSTGISSSSDFFVAALQYRTGSGNVRGLGIVKGGNFVTKSPTTAGRYVTIGRTDIDPSTSNAEPCDCLVKYIAVVANADSRTVISNNIDYLYNAFVAS